MMLPLHIRLRLPLFLFLIITALTTVMAERSRLVILADMGNEPDEEQQMVHLLLYANEVDIEGLCAVTGKFLTKEPRPELFHRLIDGYAMVVDNLKLHADGWPEPAELHAVVAPGQYRYGIEATGPGRQSPASRLIEKCLLRSDPRPLHVIVNAGSNTLAQALLDLEKELEPDHFNRVLKKLRVYENGAQDNAGAWIMHRWPSIFWIRSNYQTYAYGGPGIDGARDNKGRGMELGPHVWQPYPYSGLGQHLWALEHLKGNHGPLMALWPVRQFRGGGVSFLEGGGTIPWLRLVDVGLGDGRQADWGNWGGRYATERSLNIWSKHGSVRVDEESCVPFSMFGEAVDSWTDPLSGRHYPDSLFAPVWRWRKAVYNDFAARADWCVSSFAEANHPPRPVVRGTTGEGPYHVNAKAGEVLAFDANASTDPDGHGLSFDWWIYPEAGSYATASAVEIDQEGSAARVKLPQDAGNARLHLVLEVTDEASEHPLTRYRRFIIEVND